MATQPTTPPISLGGRPVPDEDEQDLGQRRSRSGESLVQFERLLGVRMHSEFAGEGEDPGDEAAAEQQLAELKTDRLRMATTPGRPDKHTRRRLRDRNRKGG